MGFEQGNHHLPLKAQSRDRLAYPCIVAFNHDHHAATVPSLRISVAPEYTPVCWSRCIA